MFLPRLHTLVRRLLAWECQVADRAWQRLTTYRCSTDALAARQNPGIPAAGGGGAGLHTGALHVGQPLPNLGTCSHYRHSHRCAPACQLIPDAALAALPIASAPPPWSRLGQSSICQPKQSYFKESVYCNEENEPRRPPLNDLNPICSVA